MNPERTIRKAEEHIDRVAQDSFKKNYERLQRERHGDGCGCRNCRRETVQEYNKDVDWQSRGADPVRWYVDGNGNIVWELDEENDIWNQTGGE